jgi:hypothetical protein
VVGTVSATAAEEVLVVTDEDGAAEKVVVDLGSTPDVGVVTGPSEEEVDEGRLVYEHPMPAKPPAMRSRAAITSVVPAVPRAVRTAGQKALIDRVLCLVCAP